MTRPKVDFAAVPDVDDGSPVWLIDVDEALMLLNWNWPVIYGPLKEIEVTSYCALICRTLCEKMIWMKDFLGEEP